MLPSVMSSLTLYSKDPTGSKPAQADEVGALVDSFRALYFPHPFSPTHLTTIRERFGSWSVAADSAGSRPAVSTTVEVFVEMLQAENLPSSFRETLDRISSARKEGPHAQAFHQFDLGRFCELRTAFSALRLPRVSHVYVANPNSSHDRSKVDLLIGSIGAESELPLQVKAMEGKAARIPSNIPTIKRVWRMSLTEIGDTLSKIIPSSDVRNIPNRES